ncbi:MAG: ribosome biogenesis GTPase Der, partial [Candidatus Aminicenantes bacterium]|nr:ribosome biogenesis GTPase Der [Candidatus Aminicenantes bacterium]
YEKAFVLVDTGGMFGVEEEPLSGAVRDKAWQAVRDARLVLFLGDGRRGLAPAEEELFGSLQKLGLPLFAVVNKIDSEAQEAAAADFYRLGARRLFLVSAEHKRNLDELVGAILDVVPAAPLATGEQRPLRIAIIGRINVGKSSLINRLCGEERLLVSEIPGTTRDSTDTLVLRNGKAFCLVDTAGIRKLSHVRDKREQAGIVAARKHIPAADVLCQVLELPEFPTRQDTAIARLAAESGKPLVLVLNKWDLLRAEEDASSRLRKVLFRRLEFVSYAPLLFVSAKTGKGVVKILDAAEKVYAAGAKTVGTAKLNAFLETVLRKRPPLAWDKSRPKLKYMTQQGILPPTFVLFAHGRTRLQQAYEKWLIEALRERFDLDGTPIRVFVREG